MAATSYGSGGTIRYVDYNGEVHERWIYWHVTGRETWRQMVAKAERAAKFQLGAENVKRVIRVNGNAA